MKSFSAEVGISVGTLSNYYASKPDLFLAVSLLWKDELSHRMLQRFDTADSAGEKLRAALLMLYDNMESYTGVWKEFMRSGPRSEPGSPWGSMFKKDNERLHQGLQDLLREVWRDHPDAQPLVNDPGNQLVQLMVASIMQLVMNGTESRAGRHQTPIR